MGSVAFMAACLKTNTSGTPAPIGIWTRKLPDENCCRCPELPPSLTIPGRRSKEVLPDEPARNSRRDHQRLMQRAGGRRTPISGRRGGRPRDHDGGRRHQCCARSSGASVQLMAWDVSRICSGRLAPHNAAVTPGRCSIHATASCASVWPDSAAIGRSSSRKSCVRSTRLPETRDTSAARRADPTRGRAAACQRGSPSSTASTPPPKRYAPCTTAAGAASISRCSRL